MAKSDLPNANAVGSGNLTSEYAQLTYLYSLVPRTTTGDISFSSSSSNITYATATYNSGIYAGQGQQGMLSILNNVLANYIITASDFNLYANEIGVLNGASGNYEKTNLTTFNTHLLDNAPHGAATASTASKLALRDASGNLTAKTIISDVAQGTAPLAVISNTNVANLNADLLDGVHATAFFLDLSGGNKKQTGSTNVAVTTAGTSVTVTVTFPVAFTSLQPVVTIGVTGGSVGSTGYINVMAELITLTSVTFRVNSYIAQSIYFCWEATGI